MCILFLFICKNKKGSFANLIFIINIYTHILLVERINFHNYTLNIKLVTLFDFWSHSRFNPGSTTVDKTKFKSTRRPPKDKYRLSQPESFLRNLSNNNFPLFFSSKISTNQKAQIEERDFTNFAPQQLCKHLQLLIF